MAGFFGRLLRGGGDVSMSAVRNSMLAVAGSRATSGTESGCGCRGKGHVGLASTRFGIGLGIRTRVSRVARASVTSSGGLPSAGSRGFTGSKFACQATCFRSFSKRCCGVGLSMKCGNRATAICDMKGVGGSDLPSTTGLMTMIKSGPLNGLSGGVVHGRGRAIGKGGRGSVFARRSGRKLRGRTSNNVVGTGRNRDCTQGSRFEDLRTRIRKVSSSVARSCRSKDQRVSKRVQKQLSEAFELRLRSTDNGQGCGGQALLGPGSGQGIGVLRGMSNRLFRSIFRVTHRCLRGNRLISLRAVRAARSKVKCSSYAGCLSRSKLDNFSVAPSNSLVDIFGLDSRQKFLGAVTPVIGRGSGALSYCTSRGRGLVVVCRGVFNFGATSAVSCGVRCSRSNVTRGRNVPRISFVIGDSDRMRPGRFATRRCRRTGTCESDFIRGGSMDRASSSRSIFSIFARRSTRKPAPSTIGSCICGAGNDRQRARRRSEVMRVTGGLKQGIIFGAFGSGTSKCVRSNIVCVGAGTRGPVRFVFGRRLARCTRNDRLCNLFIGTIGRSGTFRG